jgi:DNA-binding NarL/FixJ family response regulator
MIRVVVADDQPLVRSGIAMILACEPDIQVAAEAGNGEEAISEAQRLQPDIVLMDVRMPGMDGVTATRTIAADQFSRNPDAPVKVLILSTYNVQDSVFQALRAGASGFMLKDAAPAELVRAVRAIATGNGWLDPAVTAELISEFAARHDPLRPTPTEMSELTSREREVLILVAHGLSNTEIAEDLVISEATVKTHFGRILMKLRLRDRAQAVAVAYQTGLVQPGSTSFRSSPPRLSDLVARH